MQVSNFETCKLSVDGERGGWPNQQVRGGDEVREGRFIYSGFVILVC
jgi:hypothetical protein